MAATQDGAHRAPCHRAAHDDLATLEQDLATRRQFHALLAIDLCIEVDELAGATSYQPRGQRRGARFSTSAISEQLAALRALENGMQGLHRRIGLLRRDDNGRGSGENTEQASWCTNGDAGRVLMCSQEDDDDGESSDADSEISDASTVTASAAAAKPAWCKDQRRAQQLRERLGLTL
jgi:hypothetical protein